MSMRLPIVRALSTTLLLTGCASVVLSPAPAAHTLPGAPTVGVDSVAGVRITAQADAWPGDPGLGDRVHPLRITIDNHSRYTIRVRYGDFSLVEASGHRHPALPPFRVSGELMSPMLAPGFAPIVSPRFSHRRFYVAPYFAVLYPGLPVYARTYVFYDPGYYAFWYQDFSRAVRPSGAVLALALPEGVIEPDGQVSGFVYFRTVDSDAGTATFRASIVAVADGAITVGGTLLGDIAIPFTVTKH